MYWHNAVGLEKQNPFDLHILSPPQPPFTFSSRKKRLVKSQFHPRSMKYCAYTQLESTILSPQCEVGWCWSLTARHGILRNRK